MTRDVVLLGSTGSIGTQALDVVGRNRGSFRVVGLAAGGRQPGLLAEQVKDFDVAVVAVSDVDSVGPLTTALGGRPVEILSGPEAATELAGMPCDIVLNGMTGSIGLGPTLAALDAGRIVALANKESLVAGGSLVVGRAAPGQLVAVDSEHSALAQCLRGGRAGEVRRLVLTASGGPFRGRTLEQLRGVSPAQALAHPTWQMGPLVTVNSATLVNKGLEAIEAHLLFGVAYDNIEVVVHPQSIVHSMVEFFDGSTIAQLSPADMRLPIALALAWPERVADAAPALSWAQRQTLDFEPVDHLTFPAIELARAAGRAGGSGPCVFNAANEECVAAFLAGRLPFVAIVETIAKVLEEHDFREATSLAEVLDTEYWARTRAQEKIEATR